MGIQATSPRTNHTTNVIFAYSRKQAINDGVLIEIPYNMRREAGVTVHCAMTAELYAEMCVTAQDRSLGQSFEGRLWDMLSNFRFACKLSGAGLTSEMTFSLIIASSAPKRKRVVLVKTVISGGDDSEPVITFMLPDQD